MYVFTHSIEPSSQIPWLQACVGLVCNYTLQCHIVVCMYIDIRTHTETLNSTSEDSKGMVT